MSAHLELGIEVSEHGWVLYRGTAGQLDAEGLVPHGFQWPAGAANKCWQAGGFDFWLFRARPAGHKGPKRSWMEVDNAELSR